MAFEEKKYLDLAGLQSYDAKIKGVIDAKETTLDNAIKGVAGNLNTEIANREAGDKAINDKIGEVAEGKTLVQMIEEAQAAATYDDTQVKADIKANADAIDAIEADYLKAADKTELEGKITAEAEAARAAEKANADAIAAEKAKVDKLIGDDANKSVRTIANEELAAQLLSGDAEADFKTLQELAAWLEDHPEDVADINLAIENLEKLVGAIPEDATATDIVGFVQELVAAEEARADAAEKANAKDIADLKAAVGEGGAVADQINAKIQTLDADVKSADPEAGKGLQVQVVEVDGVITTVAVTGNYDESYDAKGAAAAAQTAAEATAATDATNKANQALSDAKAYVDKETGKIKTVTTEDINALFPAE